MKEAFFEPILRKFRIKRIKNTVLNFTSPHQEQQILPILLDIGCGWEVKLLKDLEPYISKGYGIDFKAPIIETGKIKTFEYTLSNEIPFENDSVNIVTMLAVLEHLSDPLSICIEIKRVLRKDGLLIITVPSKISKPVLEFLAYKLHVVSEDEIRDHKQYFDRKSLINFFDEIDGLEIIEHKYFQMGMNNFCIIKKLPPTHVPFK